MSNGVIRHDEVAATDILHGANTYGISRMMRFLMIKSMRLI